MNPYELVRLASNRGLSTGELIEGYTSNGGAALRRQEDGACVFLGDEGCTVHPDRPLACRLYPLGCVTLSNGSEAFVELEPHPETEGVYGTEGSVDGYLQSQDAGPYVEAAARYRTLLKRMLLALADGPHSTDVDETSLDGRMRAGEPGEWLDVDAVVTRHAERAGLPAPHDPWQKMLMHIEALETLRGDR